MTNPVIPAQAVEAALKEWACWPPRTELVTKMLEAAAPHMHQPRSNLTEWEACPKRHSAAAHFLDCEGEVTL